MLKIAIPIVVIILAIYGVWSFFESRSNASCENKAITASVDAYPISQYPNITERTGLQATYKQNYISENCQ